MLRHEQQDNGNCTWNRKYREPSGINLKCRALRLEKHDEIEQYRSKERANLVEYFLNAEAFSSTFLRGSKRHNGILRRFFYGLAHALDNQQSTGGNPSVLTNKCKGRNSHYIQYVPSNGHRPVLLCFVSKLAKHISHGVANKFAQSRYKPNCPCRCTKKREI